MRGDRNPAELPEQFELGPSRDAKVLSALSAILGVALFVHVLLSRGEYGGFMLFGLLVCSLLLAYMGVAGLRMRLRIREGRVHVRNMWRHTTVDAKDIEWIETANVIRGVFVWGLDARAPGRTSLVRLVTRSGQRIAIEASRTPQPAKRRTTTRVHEIARALSGGPSSGPGSTT